MRNQPEIGGARALLSLGTSENKAGNSELSHFEALGKENATSADIDEGQGNKNKDYDEDNVAFSLDNSSSSNSETRQDLGKHHALAAESNDPLPDTNTSTMHHIEDQGEVTDIIDKASQSLNDAVEAAVMRYVGGTLDTSDGLHESGGSHTDSGSHDTDDLLRKRHRLNPEDLLSEYQWDRFLEEEVTAGFERSSPRKRQRRPFDEEHDIDPDLGGLENHPEHEELVHAAILGAGELAKHLSSPLPSQNKTQQQITTQDRRNGLPREESKSAAINHLAHAATAISSGYRHPRQGIRRPLKKHTGAEPGGSEHSLAAESKYDCSSLEILMSQASSEACAWYNAQSDIGVRGPRVFSSKEIDIVENFLRGYCRLNHLSRMDICRRVWSTERPKDNFWESLTKILPYRSKASVYKHIRRQYHVFQVRAIWTPEEDELLRKLTDTAKTNWKNIGEAMNRMPEDCRDRWRNYIKCGENRVMHKWSEDEEQSLKNIVMEMITNVSQTDKPILINWTVVSERMNGVRSRIQCRYKWNKLLKRESMSRISMMDNSIKLWMLNRILESNVTEEDSVDWEYIVHMYHEMHKEKNKILWTATDFKIAFEKMRGTSREQKNASLQENVTKLIRTLYEDTIGADTSLSPSQNGSLKGANNYDELRPKPVDPRRNAENEAASVANAAVAAVSSTVSGSSSQQEEYNIWR